MSFPLPTPLLAACLVAGLALPAPPAAAAETAEEARLRPQTVALRVAVDAAGRVVSAEPVDPAAPLNGAAREFAAKLAFTPARKAGLAVPSQTTLSLQLALEPRADGNFGLQLRRASNGPGVLAVGKMEAPAGRNGGLVVATVALDADGRPDLDSLAPERVELQVPSSFAEARYLDAIRASLRGTRFQPDTVDGVAIAARASVPYRFGRGPAKPAPGERRSRRGQPPPDDSALPSIRAVSLVDGVELPRIDYTAPMARVDAPAAAD